MTEELWFNSRQGKYHIFLFSTVYPSVAHIGTATGGIDLKLIQYSFLFPLG
jgi:hypothetical protein